MSRILMDFYSNNSGNLVLAFIVITVLACTLALFIIQLFSNIVVAAVVGLSAFFLLQWLVVYDRL